MLAVEILPDVDLLKLLLAHPFETALAVNLQIFVYLGGNGLRELAGLTALRVVGRLECQKILQGLVVSRFLGRLILSRHLVHGRAGYAQLTGYPTAAVITAAVQMYDCLYIYHG